MAFLRTVTAIIAFSSITTNFLVCLLFCYKKTWLKKPYSVFLLNLAITDMTTGFLMFLTPAMIFDNPVNIPSSYFFGQIYCNVLWSRWLLFALGAVSVYTSLVLTVERWTAVCRPFKYKRRFSSRWLIVYIILIWIVGLSLSLVARHNISYHPASPNNTRPSCEMNPLSKSKLQLTLSLTAVTLKFFSPSLVILLLYAFAIAKMKRSYQLNLTSHISKSVKGITKMAGVASLALIACWSPNQIYFVLNKFDYAEVFTVSHNITILMVFLNSTLNPFIYALWGKQFRCAILSLLSLIFNCRCWTRRIRNTVGSGRIVSDQAQANNISLGSLSQ